MVEAPAYLKWGSSMDSSIPLPQRAENRSTNGSSRLRELNSVRNLEGARPRSLSSLLNYMRTT